MPIKVGKPDCNIAELTAGFGEELVGKAQRAWSILVSQISKHSLLELILEAGGPSEGWSIFKNHYAPQSAAEKARLTQAWYSLRMKDGESPNEYFARSSVIQSQLGSHGMAFSDVDANHHLARNLSHAFGIQQSILLANADSSRKVLEDVVLSAYGEMEMAREQEMRNGTGHALVAPDSGRGNGGGAGGGRERGRNNRRNEHRSGQHRQHAHQQPHLHQQQRQQPRQQQQQQQHQGGGRGAGGWRGVAQQWGAGRSGPSSWGSSGRYGGSRAQAAGGRGRGLPSYPPPGGYNYSRYPPNLPRPVSNQPRSMLPTLASDARTQRAGACAPVLCMADRPRPVKATRRSHICTSVGSTRRDQSTVAMETLLRSS